MSTNPCDGAGLPLGETFRRVDAQNVCASLDQSRNALCEIARVDASTNDVTLVSIEQFVRVGLVLLVVLAEYHVHKVVVVVNDGQRVQLVVPNNVVGFLQRGACGANDELFTGSHELGYGRIEIHAGKTIVAAGNDAQQLALALTVFGNGHGGVTALFLQRNNIAKRCVGGEVRIAAHETSLVVLYTANHCCLVFDGLGTVDERNAALLSQSYSHTVVGNGLHDCRNHGDRKLQSRLFTLLVSYKRSGKVNLFGDALRRRVTRYKQVLIKSTRGFVEIMCHVALLELSLIFRSPAPCRFPFVPGGFPRG